MSEAVRLPVKVGPRASRDEITGWLTAGSQRELAVRVCAPPEGGKANKAVCMLVASSIGVARSKVHVVRGQTSHHKMLEVEADPAAFDRWCATFPTVEK